MADIFSASGNLLMLAIIGSSPFRKASWLAAALGISFKVDGRPVHAEGIRPRRLAMILSTIRFGRMAAIKYRIGSGVMV
jgi:hypothetical protein